MPRVLLGGFNADLKDALKQRLNGYPITQVSSAQDILDELAGGSVALLIFDQALENESQLQAVEMLAHDPRWAEIPVIYCARSGDTNPPFDAPDGMQVQKTLLPPLDPEELSRQSAQALGVTLNLFADASKIQQAIDRARERFLQAISARLEVIDRASGALHDGRLTHDLREAARHEAHKLAGILRTIGFPAGSRFAREMEELLERNGRPDAAQAIRYSELAVALRLDLEKSAGKSALPPSTERSTSRISILIADADNDFAERLEAEALGHGVEVRRAADFAQASELIRASTPDVVLADLLLSGAAEDGLDFIRQWSAHAPPVPVIVLTSREAFTDRVEVARRGGHGFLARSSSPANVLEAALKLVDRLHSADAKVLAVDDDPQILSLLSTLLASRAVTVKTLDDPAQFWTYLESFAPDLLMLDVDMPKLGGLDLCRVVRNDPRWAELPVLFLTGHSDPGTVQSVFAAGADDFVPKPIVGPELLTRIFNRLERSRIQRRILELDSLTGAFNRRKSTGMMADFIDLARRHEQPFSLAVLEIGNLKTINAAYGQAAGDAALERTGRILKKAFRSEDVFARWGGGEFVVGMYGLTRYDGVERLTGLIGRIRQEVFALPGGEKFGVAISAGVAQFPEDGMNLEELYKLAAATQANAGPEAVCKAASAPSGAGRPGEQQKTDVALVMRDEAQASLLSHTLESHGYRTRWIRDGRAAGRLLAGPKPSLQARVALMEVDLPGVDGISLLKQFGAEGVLEKTRVIALTTPSVANEAQAVLELGAFDSLAKPLNPPVVVQHVRQAIDAA